MDNIINTYYVQSHTLTFRMDGILLCAPISDRHGLSNVEQHIIFSQCLSLHTAKNDALFHLCLILSLHHISSHVNPHNTPERVKVII